MLTDQPAQQRQLLSEEPLGRAPEATVHVAATVHLPLPGNVRQHVAQVLRAAHNDAYELRGLVNCDKMRWAEARGGGVRRNDRGLGPARTGGGHRGGVGKQVRGGGDAALLAQRIEERHIVRDHGARQCVGDTLAVVLAANVAHTEGEVADRPRAHVLQARFQSCCHLTVLLHHNCSVLHIQHLKTKTGGCAAWKSGDEL